jgi:predicted TIM-barrel fold metal-dependent hydrolase
MRIVDAHHHLWDRDARSYPWLAKPAVSGLVGDTTPLCRNYLLADFLADAAGLDLVASVHLQAEIAHDQALEETRWLQAIADEPGSRGFPHGIVAYADLSNPNVDSDLAAHAAFRNVRGIRQILNRHPDPAVSFVERDYLNDEEWQRGFARLRAHDLSFDMQLYWPQMEDAAVLARRHPDTQIIVNHTGMPLERDAGNVTGWRAGMRKLAQCPNIATKISGLGMTDHQWTVESIRPFVLDAIDFFGADRCLFASNFPVDRLYSAYCDIWQAFDGITSDLSPGERSALFCDNAVRLYRLKIQGT